MFLLISGRDNLASTLDRQWLSAPTKKLVQDIRYLIDAGLHSAGATIHSVQRNPYSMYISRPELSLTSPIGVTLHGERAAENPEHTQFILSFRADWKLGK